MILRMVLLPEPDGPSQRDELPGGHLEGDVVHGVEGAKPFHQVFRQDTHWDRPSRAAMFRRAASMAIKRTNDIPARSTLAA